MVEVYFVSELHNYRKGIIKCWPPKLIGKKKSVPHEWENADDINYIKFGNYFDSFEAAQKYYEEVNGMELRLLAA